MRRETVRSAWQRYVLRFAAVCLPRVALPLPRAIAAAATALAACLFNVDCRARSTHRSAPRFPTPSAWQPRRCSPCCPFQPPCGAFCSSPPSTRRRAAGMTTKKFQADLRARLARHIAEIGGVELVEEEEGGEDDDGEDGDEEPEEPPLPPPPPPPPPPPCGLAF